MNEFFVRFNRILSQPIGSRTRGALVLSVLLLLLAFAWPLWHIHMLAPQYPEGLDLHIYAHTVEGGREGADLQEINTLNHYIGMRAIDRADLSDLDWIPFAIGALVLLTLRVAAIGDVRALVDLLVIAVYFSAFSGGRFLYKLYTYGHNLDPRAPVSIEPFMPPVLGTEQLANFTVTSLPGPASLLLAAFVAVLALLAAAQLAAAARQPAA